AEVLVVEHRHDVADVRVEVDAGVQQVRPLPQARERGRVHVVPRGPQESRDALIAPPAVRATVYENVSRHRFAPVSDDVGQGNVGQVTCADSARSSASREVADTGASRKPTMPSTRSASATAKGSS